MSSAVVPLGGTKTPPLSAHALAELKHLANAPVARQSVNPGVSSRLLREALVEMVQMPSPFKAHKGAKIEHLQITALGRKTIEK